MNIKSYQQFFGRYVKGFLTRASDKDREVLALKVVHSQKVRALMKLLSKREGLLKYDIFLAELSGLFHDIGRFEQFKKYHTFLDLKSEDHAGLSVKILKKEKVLDNLTYNDREIVLDSIFVHNKFSIPSDFKGKKLIISKLLRDADKIDIWRVFNDFYERGINSDDINLGLPLGKDISDKVYKDLLAEKIVNIRDVKNQLDFMVMRLSWLYDINFYESLKEIINRKYLDTIFKNIPQGDKKELIVKKITSFLKEKDRKRVLK